MKLIAEKGNRKSALQSRVNRKLEALSLTDQIGELKDLLIWVVFDVFEPEITTDAARERIANKLKAGRPD